jgi:hypothetical protein
MAHAINVLPPPAGDEVGDLSDEQLFNAQLLLNLACGRAHSAVTRKRQQYFCYLARVLKVEADLRGVPSPPDDARINDLYRA